MPTRIQVVAPPHVIEGKSKETGNPYKMVICQAIVMQEGEDPQVCEMILPRNHVIVGPGLYDAEFGAFVDRQSKRLGGQLLSLKPVAKQ